VGATVALVILQTAFLHWENFKKWIDGDKQYAQREGFTEAGQAIGIYRTTAIQRLYPAFAAPAVSGGAK
jgi:hypothetical protein